MRNLARIVAAAVVGAALLAADRSKAVGCTGDSNPDGIPYEISASGYVRAIRDGSFAIGEVRFDLPAPCAPLRFCLPSDERSDDMPAYQPIQVGDWIDVGGSLRTDGSVLAYWTLQADREHDAYQNVSIASGVVDSLDGDPSAAGGAYSFVVRGITYQADAGRVVLAASHEFWDATNPIDDSPVAVPPLATGDTVFVAFVTDDSGARVATNVYARMSGDGTRVVGTVTDVWGDGSEFAVDGVPAVSDDATRIIDQDPADVDPDAPDSPQFKGFVAGQIVDVTGVLRGGVIFADTLIVVREPDSPGAAKLARRRGRLRGHGLLESRLDDGTVVVSGLAVRTRRLPKPSSGKSAVVVKPRRVNVVATMRAGVVLASSIRRR